eukprot:NODE_1317_length_1472_cov_12.765285_g1093_i0.p1 GENE.NODE_1317_length_1472_cov_12.765285_g1093_i0~~NODE_1317_length_1472_cov_12.765285_g1093_i0.p1  ORF type:complete len:411 (+),score=101.14 NODE_1317_length_1472_cov_12.765285_g1093_i0:111-1343(+)
MQSGTVALLLVALLLLVAIVVVIGAIIYFYFAMQRDMVTRIKPKAPSRPSSPAPVAPPPKPPTRDVGEQIDEKGNFLLLGDTGYDSEEDEDRTFQKKTQELELKNLQERRQQLEAFLQAQEGLAIEWAAQQQGKLAVLARELDEKQTELERLRVAGDYCSDANRQVLMSQQASLEDLTKEMEEKLRTLKETEESTARVLTPEQIFRLQVGLLKETRKDHWKEVDDLNAEYTGAQKNLEARAHKRIADMQTLRTLEPPALTARAQESKKRRKEGTPSSSCCAFFAPDGAVPSGSFDPPHKHVQGSPSSRSLPGTVAASPPGAHNIPPGMQLVTQTAPNGTVLQTYAPLAPGLAKAAVPPPGSADDDIAAPVSRAPSRRASLASRRASIQNGSADSEIAVPVKLPQEEFVED